MWRVRDAKQRSDGELQCCALTYLSLHYPSSHSSLHSLSPLFSLSLSLFLSLSVCLSLSVSLSLLSVPNYWWIGDAMRCDAMRCDAQKRLLRAASEVNGTFHNESEASRKRCAKLQRKCSTMEQFLPPLVHQHALVRACRCRCLCASMCICVCVYVCLYVCMRVVCVCVCMHVCVLYVYVCVCVYVC